MKGIFLYKKSNQKNLSVSIAPRETDGLGSNTGLFFWRFVLSGGFWFCLSNLFSASKLLLCFASTQGLPKFRKVGKEVGTFVTFRKRNLH